MVDFAKLKAENKAKVAAEKAKLPSIGKSEFSTEEVDDLLTPRDVAKQRLGELLGGRRNQLTEWETGFCESVLNFLLKYPRQHMSVKQEAVLQKLWDKRDSGADPTPRGNPPAQFAKTTPRSPRAKDHFDDYDDDIPF